jgi:hypothetical protein
MRMPGVYDDRAFKCFHTKQCDGNASHCLWLFPPIPTLLPVGFAYLVQEDPTDMASGELIVQSSSSTLDVQPTHVAPKVIQIGTGRKYVLLALFCLAQFLDTFNQGAIYSAMSALFFIVKYFGLTIL